MTKYAVFGDVHGKLEPLQKLLKEVLNKGYTPVFVGDLVDRGENSKEVIELIKSNDYLMVLGNHDEVMIEMYHKIINYSNEHNDYYARQSIMQWCSSNNGFSETLSSYKLGGIIDMGYGGFDLILDLENSLIELFKEHIEWLMTKPYYLKLPDIKINNRKVIISHSSVSHVWDNIQDINKNENIKDSILWGKKAPIDIKEIYNIFGHTQVFLTPEIKEYYSNVDTGCGKNGKLTTLLLPELEYLQEEG